MDTNDTKQRIELLRRQLNEHNRRYYVLNQPTISDREFDALMRELQELEAAHPEWADPLSPTQRVGSDLAEGFTQVAHRRPMLSLANTYSVDEVRDFIARLQRELGTAAIELVGEMKYDGTSISITYERGRMVRAVTRGDGTRGDDVTANVKTIPSIPLVLPDGADYPPAFEVRGEILLPWSSFDRLNAERELNEEPLFANPRNAAAGTLKLLNSAEVARRGLDARIYYLLADDLPFATHFESLEALKRWGFKVGDEMAIIRSIDEAMAFIEHWDEGRKSLPIATDGLVFKLNNYAQQRQLGATAKSPRWAVAYKFAPERALTRLLSVSFETGRMGTVTPVANLEPVLLSGTTVKRASLHNADIISQLDIHEADYLYVEKGGEIIPKIVGVETSKRLPGSKPIEFVKQCPVCGTPLVRREDEAAWVCPNRYHCPPQIVGRIEHFVARKMMNIEGIGSELAQQLYAVAGVNTVADLYDLTLDDLLKIDRLGEKSARKILASIDRSRSVPFERVVFALSIPNVGEATAKTIARIVGDIDTLMSTDEDMLAAIPDVGPTISRGIVEFFRVPINRVIVERLRIAGVQMKAEAPAEPVGNALAGKSIVVSGVFSLHSRDEYKAMIEAHGGKNASGVTSKTSFILAGDNMGPAKLEKARKLGVEIVSEDEFLKMIEQ